MGNLQLSVNSSYDRLWSVNTSGEGSVEFEEPPECRSSGVPNSALLTSTRFWLLVTCITWFRKKG
jgi:hypothetical protein